MKFNKQGKINAPIEVVFSCLTDVDYIRDEMSHALKGNEFKINYDKKDAFGIGKRIVVSTDAFLLVFKITGYDEPNHLSLNIEPNKKYLDLFGCIEYSARLEKISENKTRYNFIYESNKEPKGLFKLIIWLYAHTSLYFGHKRMKKYIRNRSEV